MEEQAQDKAPFLESDKDNDKENARRKFRELSLKKKFRHLWEYYKVPALVVGIILLVVIGLISQYVTQKKVVMNAIIGNAEVLNSSYLQKDFNNYAQIDTKRDTCCIQTDFRLSSDRESDGNMVNTVQFMAAATAGQLDAIVFDTPMFYYYAVNGFLRDLRDYYTKEELEQFEGKLYYMEQEEMYGTIGEELVADAAENGSKNEYREMIDEDAKRHRDPANFKDPVPVGIYVDDADLITSSDCYKNQVPVIGIIYNTRQIENAQKFVEYVMTQEYQPE